MRGWRLCPHGLFGWSYNTHRTRRFCRVCAKPQRRTVLIIQPGVREEDWVDVGDQEQGDFEVVMRAFEERK